MMINPANTFWLAIALLLSVPLYAATPKPVSRQPKAAVVKSSTHSTKKAQSKGAKKVETAQRKPGDRARKASKPQAQSANAKKVPQRKPRANAVTKTQSKASASPARKSKPGTLKTAQLTSQKSRRPSSRNTSSQAAKVVPGPKKPVIDDRAPVINEEPTEPTPDVLPMTRLRLKDHYARMF